MEFEKTLPFLLDYGFKSMYYILFSQVSQFMKKFSSPRFPYIINSFPLRIPDLINNSLFRAKVTPTGRFECTLWQREGQSKLLIQKTLAISNNIYTTI